MMWSLVSFQHNVPKGATNENWPQSPCLSETPCRRLERGSEGSLVDTGTSVACSDK
jgi:hypothetical protein